MAINISPIHISEAYVDLVSFQDDAIDWDNSLLEVSQVEDDGNMLSGVEAKKYVYQKEYDIKKLTYLHGQRPTVFRFKNPRILANKERLNSVRTSAFISLNPKEKPNPGVLNRSIWQSLFMNYREGVDGQVVYSAQNGNIGTEYLQAFSEAGVLEEMASAISLLVDAPKKTN